MPASRTKSRQAMGRQQESQFGVQKQPSLCLLSNAQCPMSRREVFKAPKICFLFAFSFCSRAVCTFPVVLGHTFLALHLFGRQLVQQFPIPISACPLLQVFRPSVNIPKAARQNNHCMARQKHIRCLCANGNVCARKCRQSAD